MFEHVFFRAAFITPCPVYTHYLLLHVIHFYDFCRFYAFLRISVLLQHRGRPLSEYCQWFAGNGGDDLLCQQREACEKMEERVLTLQ